MSSYENETPSGTVADDSYVSRSGPKNEEVSVQSDRERVEDPVEESVVESGLRLGMFLSLSAYLPTYPPLILPV